MGCKWGALAAGGVAAGGPGAPARGAGGPGRPRAICVGAATGTPHAPTGAHVRPRAREPPGPVRGGPAGGRAVLRLRFIRTRAQPYAHRQPGERTERTSTGPARATWSSPRWTRRKPRCGAPSDVFTYALITDAETQP
eukprot:383125-Prymnesium_polylepis.1